MAEVDLTSPTISFFWFKLVLTRKTTALIGCRRTGGCRVSRAVAPDNLHRTEINSTILGQVEIVIVPSDSQLSLRSNSSCLPCSLEPPNTLSGLGAGHIPLGKSNQGLNRGASRSLVCAQGVSALVSGSPRCRKLGVRNRFVRTPGFVEELGAGQMPPGSAKGWVGRRLQPLARRVAFLLGWFIWGLIQRSFA